MGDLVPDWIARRARTHPDVPALLADDAAWTFRQLEEIVAAGAGALRALAPDRAAPIALLAGNTAAFVATVHAAARAGMTLVPLNVRLTAPELAWQLRDSGAALVLHDDAHADLALQAASEAGSPPCVALERDGPWAPSDDVAPMPGSHVDLSTPSAIVYTSGTTGRPKGAVLTLGSWWWGAVGSALHLGHDRSDRWLAAMPLFHVGGLAILMRGAIGGVPVVLHRSFDPERFNAALDRERITHTSVVAAMASRLLDGRDASYPKELTIALLGGGPGPASLVEHGHAMGLPLAPTYGLTEAASQVTTLLPEEVAARPGSAGSPLPQAEVRIERDGEPLPPGAEGEIAIRTRTLMRGYHGHPPLGDNAWFRTGDIGCLDDAGYLRVLDRRDDLIVSGGENVYPAEVEAALASHPDVLEVGVAGAPDVRWGASPVAFVVVRPGAAVSDDELLRWAGQSLAAYKRPRRVVRMEELPRTAAGKVIRRQLRELAAGESSAP